MRVLISAYACEPGEGSEPGIGWNWVEQISRWHEVWVITRANNCGVIDHALAKKPMPNAHWVYFDLPRWARFWKKGERGLYLYYYLWQLCSYFVIKKLHREVSFEFVHHVTFGTYWMPSFLGLLPIPFVWGPVGGGESTPRGFWRCFSPRGKVYEILRDLVRALGQLDPFVRLTAQRACLGIATTPETAVQLRRLGCRKVKVLSSGGLPEEEIVRLGGFPARQGNPFRLVSIGNLIHWKGFELSLRGFAHFQSQFPAVEYWIIGDGPEKRRLRKLAQKLGVSQSVTFWGAIPRRQVLAKLADCDVLLHPSLHDSGSWVCLEAMAAGRLVTCLDTGGPALEVTEETGIKVPAISPEQTVQDLATAMERLASDPELRTRMAQAGRERVWEQFNWERKGKQMATLCDEISPPNIQADLRLARS